MNQSPSPEISVVVPCYKEAGVIRANLLTIAHFLQLNFARFEIIVVTDGSPDTTPALVRTLQQERKNLPLTLISLPRNLGKGAAVRVGVLKSQYDPVLFIDADLTIGIDELEKFLPALARSDIIIASRLLSGSKFEEPSPWHRVLMARCFHLLQIFILGNFEFPDTQCGFKLFRRQVALDLFQRSRINRFAFDAEILFLARKHNYTITTLPVHIKRDLRNTNVRLLQDSANMMIDLFKIRWNSLLGRYNLRSSTP